MSFRFEPILNLRKHRENDCRRLLKAEELILLGIKEEIAELNRRSNQQEQFLESVCTGRIDPFILSSGSGYLSYLRQKRTEAEAKRISQQKQVAGARDALIYAGKERKTMEKLKDSYLERENREALAREQKILDEIGINLVHLGKR